MQQTFRNEIFDYYLHSIPNIKYLGENVTMCVKVICIDKHETALTELQKAQRNVEIFHVCKVKENKVVKINFPRL